MKHRAWFLSVGLMLSAASLPPAHAQIFGPTDEEKAHEQGQDDQLGQLKNRLDQDDTRLQQLEDKVRSLTQSLSQATGANEDLSHQISELSQKLDRQQKDFAYRLCMLSAQQLGAAGSDQGLNCAAAGTAGAAPSSVPGGMTPGAPLPPLGSSPAGDAGFNAAPPQGRPPGTLGTLSASGPSQSGVPPLQTGSGNSAQFDSAMNLLAKAQYAEASAGFRAYADANPDDQDLSPQAIYWVGNIAFVQQDYPNAARAFAEELKKYPNAPRSADSMLKLGQSLLAEGQTSGGCTTLGLLNKKYPNASASTLAAAAGARKTSCSR